MDATQLLHNPGVIECGTLIRIKSIDERYIHVDLAGRGVGGFWDPGVYVGSKLNCDPQDPG